MCVCGGGGEGIKNAFIYVYINIQVYVDVSIIALCIKHISVKMRVCVWVGGCPKWKKKTGKSKIKLSDHAYNAHTKHTCPTPKPQDLSKP